MFINIPNFAPPLSKGGAGGSRSRTSDSNQRLERRSPSASGSTHLGFYGEFKILPPPVVGEGRGGGGKRRLTFTPPSQPSPIKGEGVDFSTGRSNSKTCVD